MDYLYILIIIFIILLIYKYRNKIKLHDVLVASIAGVIVYSLYKRKNVEGVTATAPETGSVDPDREFTLNKDTGAFKTTYTCGAADKDTKKGKKITCPKNTVRGAGSLDRYLTWMWDWAIGAPSDDDQKKECCTVSATGGGLVDGSDPSATCTDPGTVCSASTAPACPAGCDGTPGLCTGTATCALGGGGLVGDCDTGDGCVYSALVPEEAGEEAVPEEAGEEAVPEEGSDEEPPPNFDPESEDDMNVWRPKSDEGKEQKCPASKYFTYGSSKGDGVTDNLPVNYPDDPPHNVDAEDLSHQERVCTCPDGTTFGAHERIDYPEYYMWRCIPNAT